MSEIQNDQFEQGVIDTSPIVSLVAGGAATAVLLYPLVTDQSCIITGIHIFNNGAVPTVVSLGIGLLGAFVAELPGFYCVAGQDLEIDEPIILKYKFTAPITVMASVAAAAPGNVQVMVEVKYKPGVNG